MCSSDLKLHFETLQLHVGLLLADVQLKGLKMQFTLAHDKILISVFFCFFVKEKPGVV